ncbi:hypothetical protein EVJ58_g9429 [Rhodofomes roseus]|uniref:Uncharacterized protein n=1 Tax=Rhodofomes roseus TaxID=34475 RepID=A0A4Y9XWG7_9APHY|nr:hypothetical protein EVJ58_g9429 [Rhodofomes roseus]
MQFKHIALLAIAFLPFAVGVASAPVPAAAAVGEDGVLMPRAKCTVGFTYKYSCGSLEEGSGAETTPADEASDVEDTPAIEDVSGSAEDSA